MNLLILCILLCTEEVVTAVPIGVFVWFVNDIEMLSLSCSVIRMCQATKSWQYLLRILLVHAARRRIIINICIVQRADTTSPKGNR